MKTNLDRRALLCQVAGVGAALTLGRAAFAQAGPALKVGVLTDMNGPLTAMVGKGQVDAGIPHDRQCRIHGTHSVFAAAAQACAW